MSDIQYAYPLILNKVASPQYANPTLRRARLIDWLNEAGNCRAAVIAADAGYGKTTLLWQWEREVGFPCYWYKLDRNDRDWTFHISYLAESIAKRHPGFGRRAHSMLQQMGGPGSSRPGVAAYLLAEMHERLTEPCTFIIDDWQYVNAVTEVRGLWNQILRDAPATCRFVFASRVKPKLQFARFKTHGGYAELRTDALRFTEAEIDELFRDVYHDPLDPTELAELERRTEGWAASLQLVEVSLRERSTPEERRSFIESITATSDSDLFDFLAEEVLDQQTDETRNLLLSTSILQQITPEVAERLAGIHEGRRALDDLERRGLFTNRLDEERFRYHNLFREFLERRLVAERTEAEVVGLHIHAASYFETTSQWPEAIHHYLRAGLQRQAARLIAKYGEEVVAEGRLGLVDEWLQQLPADTIKQNARLSLLFGETCGIRGDWTRAIESLDRARTYFARKGDRRLEALACLKLSSVYSNLGEPDAAIEVAEAGLQLAPGDATSTRLRLEGNIAITKTWLDSSLHDVAAECQRVADEASARGFEHFAAIGHHNAGAVLHRLGHFEEAVERLNKAFTFWADPPTSPFADSSELVFALLSAGHVERARAVAADGLRRTAPWPRPHAEAVYGHAAVLIVDGRLDDAINELQGARAESAILGSMHGPMMAGLIEALFLRGRTSEVVSVARDLSGHQPDPRFYPETVAARALATHCGPETCDGECLRTCEEVEIAELRGAVTMTVEARVKIGLLAFEHQAKSTERWAIEGLWRSRSIGLWPSLRPWLRRFSPYAARIARHPDGIPLIASLAAFDPEAWRTSLVAVLRIARGNERAIVLQALGRVASKETLEELSTMAGSDVLELRRQLRLSQAPKLYVRTLGPLRLHRGSWASPILHVEKRRVRQLIAVLAAHYGHPLNREAAVEILWPESDPDAAVNSLNQTVFQLRRYIDPSYLSSESPEYVYSTADAVGFNPELVVTDVSELRRLPARLTGADWQLRIRITKQTVDLVQGEFLSDFHYEDWVLRQQVIIHSEIRERLLEIARAGSHAYDPSVAAAAASSVLRVDPYDEEAVLALADAMARTGRRVAATRMIVDFAKRLESELDVEPADFLGAAHRRGWVNRELIPLGADTS